MESGATADEWIESRVKSALIAEEGVSGSSIEVAAESGHVTLAGSVGSRAERDKAAEVARSIDGVTDVTTALAIERDG